MKIAYRIQNRQYYDDAAFEQHLVLVKEYIDCVDEVAIFVEYCHHGYMPMEELRERAAVISDRMAAYRAAGVKSVGINILNTIGQIDEAWDVMEKPPFQVVVGHDGSISKGCMCPNTKEFKEYMTSKYQLIASLNPDFIWVDDDIRMKNHAVMYPCFCDHCMEQFNREYGYDYSREQLAALLDSAEGGNERRDWILHNEQTLLRLLKMCGDAVRSVNPAIKLGLMTASMEEHWYSIQELPKMAESLGADKMRPGGGFYNDNTPGEVLAKALGTGRQAAAMPESIKDIQYEYENFPYLQLDKSLAIIDFEVAAAIMNGCSGIAFNNGRDNRPLMELICRKRAMWDAIEQHSDSKRNAGMYVLYNTLYGTRKCFDGTFFSEGNVWPPPLFAPLTNLAEIGIPMACRAQDAGAYVLCDTMAEGFSDEEIREILSQNVLMDACSAEILINRGFGKYLGIEIADMRDNAVSEVFTGHPFNGGNAGYCRDYPLTFFHRDDPQRCMSYAFRSAEGAQVLSTLNTIKGDVLGDAFVLYENELGGKVGVMGYVPFELLRSGEKQLQLWNVFDWLGGGMPVRLDASLKVLPVVREGDGEKLVFLGNCNIDETGEFPVQVRGRRSMEAYRIDQTGQLVKVKTLPNENGVTFCAQNLGAWKYDVYLLKEDA